MLVVSFYLFNFAVDLLINNLKLKNMTDKKKNSKDLSLNYLAVHRRMYAETLSDSFQICLKCSNHENVSISVTSDVFVKFLKFELHFDDLLLIYTCLCVKLGSLG